ncbi:MAG: SdpI family protein [Deltaproteobacteria bacterium]
MRLTPNTLYLGLIFLFAGGLTLLMAKKGSNLNPVAGYRTSWSMKSPETWVAANRYSGKALLLTGIITLLCGFLVWLEPLARYGLLIVMTVMTLGIVLTIVATETYLRRNFNEDGNPRYGTQTSAQNLKRSSESVRSSSNMSVRLPFSALDYILEGLTWLGIILGLAAVIICYPDLPAKIPQHYGAGGKVDAWGGKGMVVMLPVISLVLYGLMSMIRWLSPSMSGKNVSPRQWRLSIDMINWLKAITVWTFTYLSWMTLQIALGRAEALHPAFNPIMLGSMTLIMVFYIWRILKAAE